MFKLFLLLFLTVPLFVYPQEFIIETSRGERTLEVPEGYTIEEAFQEMAVLYLEERWDHEETTKDLKKVTEQLEGYPKRIENYRQEVNELITQYEELENLYQQALKPELLQPIVSASYGYTLNGPTMGLGIGVRIYERLDVSVFGEYPPTLRLGIGVRF